MQKFLIKYVILIRRLFFPKKVVTLQFINFLLAISNSHSIFSVGDIVESIYGDQVFVTLVFSDIKTNKPIGCAVKWTKQVASTSTIAPFVPVVALGKKFNPIIRKVKSSK